MAPVEPPGGGEKVWEAARRRDPAFTCAKLFWWYNMYASVDFAVTPRPMYLADGRKLPDIHTYPSELRDELQGALGEFPLFRFWGPGADIESSRWIARSALQVLEEKRPTLTLVYLPHLDYDLQRFGPHHPGIPAQVAAVDALCGPLIEKARTLGAHVVVLSEYGITEVSRPVHVNRALREAGWLKVRLERGREQLDAGASDAFAVADHQLAHVYVARPALVPEVAACLKTLPGVETVLDLEGKRAAGLDHPRSGELVAVAKADSWFTYYHFLDDARAPDFARTVEIHRKPGYDPVELLIDPKISLPETRRGIAPGAQGARHALSDGCHRARRDSGARVARPPHRSARGRSAVHHHGARAAGGWARARHCREATAAGSPLPGRGLNKWLRMNHELAGGA